MSLDELLGRIEKALDQAKADPQAFLDNHQAMESLAADSSERDLLVNELNSRLTFLYAECDSVANILAKAAFEKGLVFDESLRKLLQLLILNSPKKSK